MEQHLERRSRLLLLDRREEALSCEIVKVPSLQTRKLWGSWYGGGKFRRKQNSDP